MPSKTRILIFDIETMAKKAYVWGNYEQNIIATAQDWYMLSYAYKWYGEKTTYVQALPDYKLYKTDPSNDNNLVNDLWKLFDEADIVMAHNGRKFDVKKSNARFIKHGLQPPSPYKIIDTREVAKRYFMFDSNKLDDLGEYLGLGRKINTGGFELWLRCEKGEKSAWDKMKKYNKQDIVLLEKVYLKMLPFMNNHPNIGLLDGNLHACPNCGSLKLQRRGFMFTRVSAHQRYQCNDCKSWSQAPNGVKQVR